MKDEVFNGLTAEYRSGSPRQPHGEAAAKYKYALVLPLAVLPPNTNQTN
ncbi:TPA: hypothetical protein R8G15_001788 [Citrobacter freundii]|uniref:Uncharacterized protein n=1 Tax=Citrobacter youngae ATCC 29220 TaxID=500640 RepID=D4BJL5_9ENTR|nr:hypothetical protein CIT292_10859 [Citrobacter youngae ATCC 29220]KWZ91556.1 hypothetical protein HMPREF3212_01751 [Citrobacter freundii]HEE9868322.1 hypothetical protein [Citrobacter freundii]